MKNRLLIFTLCFLVIITMGSAPGNEDFFYKYAVIGKNNKGYNQLIMFESKADTLGYTLFITKNEL